MKKIIIIAILSLIIFACHRKTVVSSTSAKSNDMHASLVDQGKIVYVAKCGKCHGLKNTANYTADRWTKILKAMIPKAKLNESEAQQVTAYVMVNAKP
jgi:mono/diheme cytochrome c family protein